MFGRTKLEKALRKWVKEGGDIHHILSSNGDQPVRSEGEALAICAALDALRADALPATGENIRSALHKLTAFFQQVEDEVAFELLKDKGLPRLRTWVRALIDGIDVDENTGMFVMKILAMYRQREDVDLIAEAARKPINENGFMWSVIFSQFDTAHQYSVDMIEALRDPLPNEFILICYLDMANGLAIGGMLDHHPFDSTEGTEHLETWLRDTNEERFDYAISATAALPFIDEVSRERLLAFAHEHPEPTVQIEGSWAQAKSGDPRGLQHLAELCLDYSYSYTAQKYLEELGRADRIPSDAQDANFQTIAEMAHWLAHPSELGRPPDDIELIDTREIFWPPTNDTRRVSLVKFSFEDEESGNLETGVGMVGSVTFALFGETTPDLSPEDIYGLHCSWELEMNGDPRAQDVRSADAGRAILARHNEGFRISPYRATDNV